MICCDFGNPNTLSVKNKMMKLFINLLNDLSTILYGLLIIPLRSLGLRRHAITMELMIKSGIGV